MDIVNYDEDPEFKVSDASLAAPFTNKHTNSIKCVSVVLKQGLCAIMIGIQNYRIITLEGLINGFTMAFLHMENLKYSEYQNVLLGVYGMYLFYL